MPCLTSSANSTAATRLHSFQQTQLKKANTWNRMMLFLILSTVLLSYSSGFELCAGLPHNSNDILEKNFWEISDPQSTSYLKHLSREQIKDMIKASELDLHQIQTWFTSIGATSTTIGYLGDTVTAVFPPTTTFDNGKNIPTHLFDLDFLLRRDPIKKSPQDNLIRSTQPFDSTYSPSAQKQAYGIPADLAASANSTTLQMVWGPGTFGYSLSDLTRLKNSDVPLLNLSRVNYDTANHGQQGGDNFGEGNLDTQMITSFGLNIHTLISNTNTSASTEEGNGFGQALLDFVTELSGRKTVPHVLSLSLGSLGATSCNMLCDEAVKKGISKSDCNSYLQNQRQVCMFLSTKQVNRISNGFKILGARGVSIFGSSGDGGSHFSFQEFEGGNIANVLNEVSCEFTFPVFPTTSPYVISVGGTDWSGFFNPNSAKPKAWSGSGGGFSWQFPQPAHQMNTVSNYVKMYSNQSVYPASTAYNMSGRAYPDISAVAVDGTSQSSPTTAGIWSLLMDHRLNAGLPPLGFLGPRLYQVNEKYPNEAYESVQSGNTKTSCDNGFPSSSSGWDPVTGWGRPVWAGMIKHFGSD